MKIFIIAGEESGDLIAYDIVKTLNLADFSIKSVSGMHLNSLGISSIFDSSKISIMGFLEIIPRIFTILRLIKFTVKNIIEFKPDLILTIDSPGFSFRVIKKIQYLRPQTKIWHIVAPSVWAYKPRRAAKIAKIYDKLFCILPFEPPYFTKHGLDAIYVGYLPYYRLQSIIKSHQRDNKYMKKSVSITLGSRKSEIMRHIPIMLDVMDFLLQSHVQVNILVTENTRKMVQKSVPSTVKIISDPHLRYTAILESQFIIAKSGTNVMDAAILGTPCIVYYKANFFTSIIVRAMIRVKMCTILNIIAGEHIFPEFIQAKSGDIIDQAKLWLENPQILVSITQRAAKIINDNLKTCENPSTIISNLIMLEVNRLKL